ncbi:hypothetical protein FAES_4009 [Fibrella aestuarina BUZ 2]|uniref:AntA/AntB antirepressor domain-containing protein n=1 Tax=Fibrella aestuarina BUZ 2 TaxID=1166018 RepID=I0KD06_9BACT|nr:antA/AntB antirepressor family protein [Fibrella aestuarina]CCH02009.1 hypothetical protein FAES_4009 [Fibrella aestuarina BUZ 2]
MEALIQITTDAQGASVVSARELHAFLEVKSDFFKWFTRRVEKYGFVEGQDYIRVAQKRATLGGEQETVDYALTLDCAKELAMVQNNEQGKRARLYFIEAEKQLRTVVPQPSLSSQTEQLLIGLLRQQTELSQQQAAIQQSQQLQLARLQTDVAAIMAGMRRARKPVVNPGPPAAVSLYGEPVLPMAVQADLRKAISNAVNDYCGRFNATQLETYRYLYNRMQQVYGVNVWSLTRKPGESVLDALETYGQLDRLYALVQAELAYQE